MYISKRIQSTLWSFVINKILSFIKRILDFEISKFQIEQLFMFCHFHHHCLSLVQLLARTQTAVFWFDVKFEISMLWMTVSWCELLWTDVGHTMHKHECAHLSRCTLNVTNNYQSKQVFIYDVCLAHNPIDYSIWYILSDRFIQKSNRLPVKIISLKCLRINWWSKFSISDHSICHISPYFICKQ